VVPTPDGRQVIGGSGDCTLKVWDFQTGQLASTLLGHNRWVTSVAVTPDGRHAVSGSDDRTLKLWDLETGRLRLTYIDPELQFWDLDGTHRPVSAGHKAGVFAVAVTPDGRQVISASHDYTLKLWDLETGKLRQTFYGHMGWVNDVVITPDGKQALSGSGDHTLRIWHIESGQLRFTLPAHSSWVTAVAVTPHGRHAVSCSNDLTVKLWDLEQQRCEATVLLESAPWAVAITPDGQGAIVGDRGGNVHFFGLQFAR
jgi:WD40 repeat protein